MLLAGNTAEFSVGGYPRVFTSLPDFMWVLLRLSENPWSKWGVRSGKSHVLNLASHVVLWQRLIQIVRANRSIHLRASIIGKTLGKQADDWPCFKVINKRKSSSAKRHFCHSVAHWLYLSFPCLCASTLLKLLLETAMVSRRRAFLRGVSRNGHFHCSFSLIFLWYHW